MNSDTPMDKSYFWLQVLGMNKITLYTTKNPKSSLRADGSPHISKRADTKATLTQQDCPANSC
jgi:hypothetical protein